MESSQEIKTIMKRYYLNEIRDNEELYNLYKEQITQEKITEAFEVAITSKDTQAIEDILHIGFVLNLFNNFDCKIFCVLLQEQWHNRHEDITQLFQHSCNRDVSSISILLNAIDNIPEYLQEDDFKYPYVRKLIYAIGAQPEPYNIEALEKSANETNDEKIRELALYQIEKRKRLGRWEAAKNAQ
jgi:hypothetical protein